MPAWSSDGIDMSTDDFLLLARGGHGPGDGAGNGGTGPGDGTGNGSKSGDCPNLETNGIHAPLMLARGGGKGKGKGGGNCGRNSGKGSGKKGSGGGNRGVCPWGLNQ